jgi:hypothetical protein
MNREKQIKYRYCKPCGSAARQEWATRNPEAEREYSTRWQRTAHGKVSRRNSHLLSKFGISIEDYERALAKQDGKCAICGEPYSDQKKLHVDHDHKTGEIRGLLCFKCNHKLAVVEDVSFNDAAQNYLRNPPWVE